MEELLLWRWSTAVQISSALLLAVFFLAVGRSASWRGIRHWVGAWVCNGLALLITWVYWLWQPGGAWVDLLRVLYLLSKTGFLVLLLLGTLMFVSGAAPRLQRTLVITAFVALALFGSLFIHSIDQLGLIQASLIALLLGSSAAICHSAPGQGLGWLSIGLLLRTLLAVAESIAYGWRYWAEPGSLPDALGFFLAAHSSFDTGAEWVIALGCVLAMAHRAQTELSRSHEELSAAHEELRRVAERDPLTGLFNRRMLPSLFQRLQALPTRLLFFDLDNFKRINDSEGHDVGDACLRHFALNLQYGFPDAEAVLRLAGDEFLVIMREVDESEPAGNQIDARLAALRARLRAEPAGLPVCEFSVGEAHLPSHGSANAALRAADQAMYRDKSERRQQAP